MRDELAGLWNCLADSEAERLKAIYESGAGLEPALRAELEEAFRHASRSLPLVAEAIREYPSADARTTFGGRERDNSTLIESLCRTDEADMDFMIPTGAVLGRAFVQAKINFLKSLERLFPAPEEGQPSELGDLVGDAVFSRLAEELLSAVLANPHNPIELKRVAATRLVSMWKDRLKMPVGEFPQALLSSWKARRRVRAIFGTLIGVTEVFSLMKADCESQFLNYFSRDKVTQDETQAFQEFLFGLAYEELCEVREYMKDREMTVISPEEVRELIKSPVRPPFFGYPTPDQMYASYRRRRTRAEYRAVSGSPGPRKTAEGYLMEGILREEIGGD